MFRRIAMWLLKFLRRSGNQLEPRLALDAGAGREWVAMAASKDPSRWHLSCAWYCEDRTLVATDGHRMHVLRNAHDESPRKPVDPKVQGEFPNWQVVYPNVAHVVVVDAGELCEAIRAVAPWLGRADVNQQGHVFIEAHERGLTVSSQAARRMVDLKSPAEFPRAALNPRYVLEALRGASGALWLEAGAEQYSPVLFRRGDSAEAIIMPVRA